MEALPNTLGINVFQSNVLYGIIFKKFLYWVLRFPYSSPHHHLYELDSYVVWTLNPCLSFLVLTLLSFLLFLPLLSLLPKAFYVAWSHPDESCSFPYFHFLLWTFSVVFFFLKSFVVLCFAFFSLKYSFSHIRRFYSLSVSHDLFFLNHQCLTGWISPSLKISFPCYSLKWIQHPC